MLGKVINEFCINSSHFFCISVTDNHFDNLRCEKRIISTLSALNKNKYIFNRTGKLRHILGESVIENWLLREV